MSERRHTADVEFQHRQFLGARHEFTWGLGYRFTHDATVGSAGGLMFFMDPADRTDQLFSAFVQDDVDLGHWRLNLGSKFEHNSYTGFEIQPSARLLRRLGEQQSVWAAASRAVRTPSRAELHMTAPSAVLAAANAGDPFTVISFLGNPAQDSENLLALEAGYRVQPNEHLFGEVAAFYNFYTDLRSFQLQPARTVDDPVPYNVVPLNVSNLAEAQSCGVELEADWQALPRLRLRSTYTYLKLDIDALPGDPVGESEEVQSPKHQAMLGGTLDLQPELDLDVIGRYVHDLPTLNVDGYFNLDARLAWQAQAGLQVALVGQNLLAAQRSEFTPEFINSLPAETQRGIYLSFRWSPAAF